MAGSNESARASRHLVINPFGLATLMGRNIVVPNDRPTNNPVGTEGFEYLIRANPSQTYDVQFRDEIGATINVEMGGRVMTRLRIMVNEMYIGNGHFVNETGLRQRFVQEMPNYNEMRATFRLVLTQSQMFRRLDVRYSNFSWVTILFYNYRVMAVVLNGPNLVEYLQLACEETMQRGVQSQRQQTTPSNQFGLRTHSTISRNTSRAGTPDRDQHGNNDVPRLIPTASLTAEQLALLSARRARARAEYQALRQIEAQPNVNDDEDEVEGAVGGENHGSTDRNALILDEPNNADLIERNTNEIMRELAHYSQSVADLLAEQITRPFRWSNPDDRDTERH